MDVHLLRLILHLCLIHHVDPLLAESVIKVESGWNSSVVGKVGELGLFQLNPISFPSISNLQDSKVNVTLGIEYLAQMQKECVHKENNSFVLCFNRGLFGGTKVKDYKVDKYYIKVMEQYNKLKGEYENQNFTL